MHRCHSESIDFGTSTFSTKPMAYKNTPRNNTYTKALQSADSSLRVRVSSFAGGQRIADLRNLDNASDGIPLSSACLRITRVKCNWPDTWSDRRRECCSRHCTR